MVHLFSAPVALKPTSKPVTNKRGCNHAQTVEVYLFVNEKRLKKANMNFIARIAIINKKESFVSVHFWDVTNSNVTVKLSKPKKVRFRSRKARYVKLGETRLGKTGFAKV